MCNMFVLFQRAGKNGTKWKSYNGTCAKHKLINFQKGGEMLYISLVVEVKYTSNLFSSITWQELVKLEVNTDGLNYLPSSLKESFTQKNDLLKMYSPS